MEKQEKLDKIIFYVVIVIGILMILLQNGGKKKQKRIFRQFVKIVNYVRSVHILIYVSYKHWICISGVKHEAKFLCL